MFKFITVIFLTVHVALVLGIMTKEDLPQEIQNCLDNVLIPGIRLHASCKLSNDEDDECKRKKGDDDEHSKCQDRLYDLPPIDYTFAKAYLTNENINVMKINLSSELPENVRNCIDNIKPIMQAYFQAAKDCEAVIATDNPETPDPYQECMDKIPNVYQNSKAMKCMDIVDSLDEKQRRFVNPYASKVFFEL